MEHNTTTFREFHSGNPVFYGLVTILANRDIDLRPDTTAAC